MDDKYAGPVGLVGGGVAGALLGGVVGSKVGHKNLAATIGGVVLGSAVFGLAGLVAGTWYETNYTGLSTLVPPVLPDFGNVEKNIKEIFSTPIKVPAADAASLSGTTAGFP